MIMMHRNTSQSGFTLLEIILTILVTAVLSAIILQAMGTNIQRSTFPLFTVRNTLSLQQVMENITADYKQLFLTDATPMAVFENRIVSGTYWTPTESFTGEIVHISFVPTDCDPPSAYDRCFQEQGCSGEDCHLHRVIITHNSTGRNLSALFAD